MPTRARSRQPATGQRKQAAQAQPRTAKVDLPFVHAEFRAPQLRMPSIPRVPLPRMPRLPRVGRDEVTAAARSVLPSPREAAYYGGLALLAVLEVIEWPVAAVIGVGTAVIGRGRDGGDHQEGRARVPSQRQ